MRWPGSIPGGRTFSQFVLIAVSEKGNCEIANLQTDHIPPVRFLIVFERSVLFPLGFRNYDRRMRDGRNCIIRLGVEVIPSLGSEEQNPTICSRHQQSLCRKGPINCVEMIAVVVAALMIRTCRCCGRLHRPYLQQQRAISIRGPF